MGPMLGPNRVMRDINWMSWRECLYIIPLYVGLMISGKTGGQNNYGIDTHWLKEIETFNFNRSGKILFSPKKRF